MSLTASPIKIYLATFLVMLCLQLTGCASNPSHPRDPLEPINRITYTFNDKADRWVMKPVAQGYHDYTPNFFRSGISNFFSNLNDANSTINFALQGEGKASLYNFSRFLLNSTVGILGFLDITSGEERNYGQTGFGDTFSVWGWKNSAYLVMPLAGPSTLRDGTGAVGSIVFRENTLYSNPHDDAKLLSNVIDGIHTRDKLLGIEDAISDAALDPYSYTRDAWLQMRAKQLGEEAPKNSDEEDFDIDDLVE